MIYIGLIQKGQSAGALRNLVCFSDRSGVIACGLVGLLQGGKFIGMESRFQVCRMALVAAGSWQIDGLPFYR